MRAGRVLGEKSMITIRGGSDTHSAQWSLAQKGTLGKPLTAPIRSSKSGAVFCETPFRPWLGRMQGGNCRSAILWFRCLIECCVRSSRHGTRSCNLGKRTTESETSADRSGTVIS